jgi:hypothetical protein
MEGTEDELQGAVTVPDSVPTALFAGEPVENYCRRSMYAIAVAAVPHWRFPASGQERVLVRWWVGNQTTDGDHFSCVNACDAATVRTGMSAAADCSGLPPVEVTATPLAFPQMATHLSGRTVQLTGKSCHKYI